MLHHFDAAPCRCPCAPLGCDCSVGSNATVLLVQARPPARSLGVVLLSRLRQQLKRSGEVLIHSFAAKMHHTQSEMSSIEAL